LDAFLLNKAVYEIGYELSYRPDFLAIPLRAACRLLEEACASSAEDVTEPPVTTA